MPCDTHRFDEQWQLQYENILWSSGIVHDIKSDFEEPTNDLSDAHVLKFKTLQTVLHAHKLQYWKYNLKLYCQ